MLSTRNTERFWQLTTYICRGTDYGAETDTTLLLLLRYTLQAHEYTMFAVALLVVVTGNNTTVSDRRGYVLYLRWK